MAKKTFTEINPYKIASAKELKEIQQSLAKTANSRLKTLRKAGIDYGALSIAEHYLGSRRTFTSSQSNVDALRREILATQRFLTSQTSTLTGIKERVKAQRKAMAERGFDFADDKEFYEFFESAQYNELVKSFTSTALADAYDQAKARLSDGEIKERLNNLITEYRQRRQDISLKDIQRTLGNEKVLRPHPTTDAVRASISRKDG